ncbi:MAG: class I SAM-dependent methyltransferase [Opitutaceae bacterium]|nr:class I SAM-dependent methyltransferase [Opitutaceae bacterium]
MNPSRGYDQLARVYRLIEFLAFGRALERARFQHFARLQDCKRILLLGDGDGRGLALACRLAPHARIDSVDFSAGMLDHAARRLRSEDRDRVTLRQADALTSTFPADTYDAVTTLFFLDCFSGEQVRVFIERLRPALKPDVLWLYADFALPPCGFFRTRAQVWLALMFCFFRWKTGLTVRALPQAEALLHAAGFRRLVETSWQGGFIISAVFQQIAK